MAISKRWRRASVLLLVPFVVEFGFRALVGPLGLDASKIGACREFLRTGHLVAFEPRAHTVFQRPTWMPGVNEYGFSDEPWPIEREAGEFRVLCLGASTTESGNPKGRRGSFPYLLEPLLEERTGRPCRVMNGAISGWTTAEMVVAWFLLLRDFAPDVLVLHEAVSDLPPRFLRSFRPDYSHWRRPLPSSGVHGLERWLTASDLYVWFWLTRRGVPDIGELTSVPMGPRDRALNGPDLPEETARPFARNLESITRDARALGARVVLMTMPSKPGYSGPGAPRWTLGMQQHNELVRALARREGHDLVDAAQVFEARAAELAPEFLDLVHLSPAGNALKAELRAELLAPATEAPAASGAGLGPSLHDDAR
jgi:lysophospholipase L1-like esterase